MTLKDNVHLHEINKFGSMAERWWDMEGEFKTLHDINPLRLEFIQKFVDNVTDPLTREVYGANLNGSKNNGQLKLLIKFSLREIIKLERKKLMIQLKIV